MTLLILWQIWQSLCTLQAIPQLIFFLDNNTTHKNKMKAAFREQLEVPLSLRLHHFPSYTPLCHPTEYVIHLIRQKYLHHHDYKLKLQELEKMLTDKLVGKTFLAPEQVVNILEHIHNLVLSP